MSIKMLLTTAALLAGSSTAALADPHYGHGPVVRDHDRHERVEQRRFEPARRYMVRPTYETRWYRPRVYGAPTYVSPTYVWPSYGSPTYVSPTYAAPANGSQYIALGNAAGNELEVALVNGEGSAFVDQVIIHYADGRDVPMHLDRQLDLYNPHLELQTEAYPISGITVTGSGAITAFVE